MTYPTGDADMGVGGNAWTDGDGNIWSDTLNAWVTPDGQYYYTGSGWSPVSAYDPWGTGSGTTTTPKATTTTPKTTSSGYTSGGSTATSTAWVDPQDKNGDGIDDSTGYANGVVKVPTSVSWTGYTYNGIPVWPNGAAAGAAPASGGGTSTPEPADRWTGQGPKGYGTYLLDGPGGTPGTFFGSTQAPKAPTSTSGGSTSTSGSSSTRSGGFDNTTTNVRSGGYTDTNISEYGPERAALEREALDLQERMNNARTELERAQLAQELHMFTLRHGLDERKFGLDQQQFGLNRAKTIADLMQTSIPADEIARLALGGGNIENAIQAGARPSDAELFPLAQALGTGTDVADTHTPPAGGGTTTPPAGGGSGTPTPTTPGTPPPATPPAGGTPTTPGSDWENRNGRWVNTNKDPNHGVISWGTNEGGGAIGGGLNPYAGRQYQVVAGPTAPTAAQLAASSWQNLNAPTYTGNPVGATNTTNPYATPTAPNNSASLTPQQAAERAWSGPTTDVTGGYGPANTQPGTVSGTQLYGGGYTYDPTTQTWKPQGTTNTATVPGVTRAANGTMMGGLQRRGTPNYGQSAQHASPMGMQQRAAAPQLGFVRDPMMMTGDAPMGMPPTANGARPEIIVNPTRAPIGVIPNPMIAVHSGANEPGYVADSVTPAARTLAPQSMPPVWQGPAPTGFLEDVPRQARGTMMGGLPRRYALGTTQFFNQGDSGPGLGVTPFTATQYGATAGDQSAIDRARAMRSGVQVPNVSAYDVAFNALPPSLRALFLQSREAKYGISQADQMNEIMRQQLPGYRTPVTVGY